MWNTLDEETALIGVAFITWDVVGSFMAGIKTRAIYKSLCLSCLSYNSPRDLQPL